MRAEQLKEYIDLHYYKRSLWNVFVTFLLGLSSVLVLFFLGSVFGYLLYRGFPSLNLHFFLNLPTPVGEVGGGMANGIMGSFLLVLLSSLIGIPWGVLTGIYLSEYGKKNHFVRFCVDMLSSVPSIVIGLFVYVILVKTLGGFSLLAGSFSLTFILVPTIARTTEELLKMVPETVREAGLALGISRRKMILRILLKGSLPGILTGVMLAIARIAGETAPLLFTALNNRFWSFNLFKPISSLPVQIYTYAISPFEDWNRQAWAGALMLVLFVFSLNLIVRFFLKPLKGNKW